MCGSRPLSPEARAAFGATLLDTLLAALQPYPSAFLALPLLQQQWQQQQQEYGAKRNPEGIPHTLRSEAGMCRACVCAGGGGGGMLGVRGLQPRHPRGPPTRGRKPNMLSASLQPW